MIHLNKRCLRLRTLLHALIGLCIIHNSTLLFHLSIVVSATAFDYDSPALFMPVSRIASRCVTSKTTFCFDYGKDPIIVAMPMSNYIH